MESVGKKLSALRRSIACTDRSQLSRAEKFSFGLSMVDGPLGGGLVRGSLHEVYAAEGGGSAAASGFTLALALRAKVLNRKIIWIRNERARWDRGGIFASGLVEFGARFEDILLVEVRDPVAVLRAGNDAVRCRSVAVVIVEIFGESKALDLTATRRLSMVSEQSGITTFLLREGASPRPSSAQTRWEVKSGSSFPLSANAPGNPVFNIRLLRHRQGIPLRSWRVEWNRDEYRFREPAPLSRPMAAVSFNRAHPPESEQTLRRTG